MALDCVVFTKNVILHNSFHQLTFTKIGRIMSGTKWPWLSHFITWVSNNYYFSIVMSVTSQTSKWEKFGEVMSGTIKAKWKVHTNYTKCNFLCGVIMTAKDIQCYDYQPKFLHVRHQYGHMGIWKLSYYFSQLIRYWGMKDKNLLTINNMEKRHMIFRLAITMWPIFISCNIIFLLNVGLHFRWLLLPRCGEIQKIVPKSQIKGVQGI